MMSNLLSAPMTRGKAEVALVSFDSLGDSLIYVMIAENLRMNGHDVICYGNIAYQMRHWLPNLNLRPYPATSQFEEELDKHDLVIISPPQFIRQQMDEQYTERVRQKWLLVCQTCPPSWHFDQTERIRSTRTTETFEQLKGLLNCSGPIRFKEFADESVVEMTLQYMKERMHLQNVRKNVTLSPPLGLQHRRYPKRIIISPDSAGPEKKNWTPASFIKLGHELKSLGYAPEIVVAPKNHSAWARMKNNVFETPLFPDIEQLSSYIFESGVVIANDSGNGHLASFLGIPVVTIYRKRNQLFHWRPDWGPVSVVCPRITLPGLQGSIWKPFIRKSDVIAALKNLT